MAKPIDYYFAVQSPWAFLGSARFEAIAQRYDLAVNVRPANLADLFSETGGLPLAKRAPARRAYRDAELDRWSRYLGIKVVQKPRYFPVDEAIAAHAVIRVARDGGNAMAAAHRLMACLWIDDADLADPDVVRRGLADAGFDPAIVDAAAADESLAAIRKENTDAAVAANAFGSPAYVLDGEVFWGQDRLELLEWRLSGAPEGAAAGS